MELSYSVVPLIACLFAQLEKGQNLYSNLLMFLVAILSLSFFLCGERIGHGFRQVPPDPLYFRKVAKVVCGCFMGDKETNVSQEEEGGGKGGFVRKEASKQGGKSTGRKERSDIGVEQGGGSVMMSDNSCGWCNYKKIWRKVEACFANCAKRNDALHRNVHKDERNNRERSNSANDRKYSQSSSYSPSSLASSSFTSPSLRSFSSYVLLT